MSDGEVQNQKPLVNDPEAMSRACYEKGQIFYDAGRPRISPFLLAQHTERFFAGYDAQSKRQKHPWQR